MDKDLLYRFFEGRASVDEMRTVKEWAEASEENNILLRRERKFFDAMILVEPLKKVDLDSGFRWGKRYLIREFMKVASIVLITVSITFGLFSIGNDDKDEIAMQTITVPAGQRVNLELPDGSNVWLNAGTVMQYPASFMKNKREITLDGEAYFEVAHNKKSPFIVHTHAMDVEVLGTEFNVEAYKRRKVFETSLIQGKVRIKSPSDEKTFLVLSPNYKTSLKDNKLVVSKIEDYNVYRWREGLYCFKNKPFIEILENLERYYELRIVLEKQSIAKIVLTGKFRISDGLDYALRVLQQDVAFTYYRNEENDMIYIK